MNCSDVTAAEVDSEVMKILKECYEEALSLLRENRAVMDKIAAYLIEKETITGKEFMKIYRREKGIPEPEETQEQPGKSTETQERFGFRQESGSAQGQRADGNTAPQGVRPEQPDGRTEPAAGEQSEPYGQAGPVQADPNQDDWWDQSSSGIPGQDMGFFRDEEEQNEDGQDHKDGQNPPQGTVGRFSNTVIPPSDQNH